MLSLAVLVECMHLKVGWSFCETGGKWRAVCIWTRTSGEHQKEPSIPDFYQLITGRCLSCAVTTWGHPVNSTHLFPPDNTVAAVGGFHKLWSVCQRERKSLLQLIVSFSYRNVCFFSFVKKATEEFKQLRRPKPSQRGLMRYSAAFHCRYIGVKWCRGAQNVVMLISCIHIEYAPIIISTLFFLKFEPMSIHYLIRKWFWVAFCISVEK